ncbi:aminoacyl-histidine dipeptidase [Bacteroidales bacterium]
MNIELNKLQPNPLWSYFREITLVPRPSKHEEKIIDYLIDFAKNHQLAYHQDEVGNVFIYKNATKGYEDRQITVLQSHIDMVCEKNSDTEHDFFNDPIKTTVEGEWVKAIGTTLGADDGIGIAAQLAILAADDIEHGPIECLFTVDEETGLTGAFGLSNNALKGKILLNLDSEDEGELFIGCAGGKDTVAMLPYRRVASPKDAQAFEIRVSGLKGGHSGDDIHKGLGNANKLMVRILSIGQDDFQLQLSWLEGGNLRNAIAREAMANVLVPNDQVPAFVAMVNELGAKMKAEYAITEPLLKIEVNPMPQMPETVVAADDQRKLILALYACPHGVIAYSQSIPGFVETSTNLASVRSESDHFLITTSQRSSVESAKDDIVRMVSSCFLLAGAEVENSNGYPGWAPNPYSKIREITVESYKRLFGNEPVVKAIHAGLECGLIGDKYPEMDMISFGPTIKGAHSPDERIEIATVQKFWELTLDILKNIPKA